VDTADVTLRKDDDGTKYINQYQIIKELGKGSFGKVKLIKHTETGEQFGMKIFNKNILKKKRMGTRNMLQVSLSLSLSLCLSLSLALSRSMFLSPPPHSLSTFSHHPYVYPHGVCVWGGVGGVRAGRMWSMRSES